MMDALARRFNIFASGEHGIDVVKEILRDKAVRNFDWLSLILGPEGIRDVKLRMLGVRG